MTENSILNYAAGPQRLEAVLAGLSEAELDTALSNDSWTIRQIVHHIADGDDIWKGFIKMAMGNPQAEFTLEWYWRLPQVTWAQEWAYASRPIEPSLGLLCANRAHVVQLLECIPGAWEKSLLVHWPNGEEQTISVGWVVELQTRHLEGHIEDIRMILEAHRL
jgi:hypothetical protein